MTVKLKAKVTFEWEYTANPKDYDSNNAQEMIEIDKRGANNDIFMFVDMCPNEPIVEISEVK